MLRFKESTFCLPGHLPSHIQSIEKMIKETEDFLKINPSDISARAVLAALTSTKSIPDAREILYQIPLTASLTASVDVALLEFQGIPSTASTLPTTKPRSVKKPRRVRGKKVYDPSVQVDPERWLPLWERSYYKPSKKRKTGGATQGGLMESEAMSRGNSGQPVVVKGDVGGKKKKKNRK
jgi:signal recognition particle subunit SRP72